MKHPIWTRSLILVALLSLAPLAWAQNGDLTPRLVKTDWEQIDTHVFQRQLEDGTVETVGTGLEMVAWELGQVNERIADLEDLALELGELSPELMDSLSFYRARARELEAELNGEGEQMIPLQPQTGELRSLAGALGCSLVITRNASANPTTTGPRASATAAFSDTCGTFGQVKATAYAEGIYSGSFRACVVIDPASGRRSGNGSASATASCSVVATSNCYSYAVAEVWVRDSNGNLVYFTKSATNSICRIILPNPGECLTSEGLQNCVPKVP